MSDARVIGARFAAPPGNRPDMPNHCVATVATPSFLPGAVVTLGSFLDRHPGFAGDLVVIHDGLPKAAREPLAALPRLRFERISAALRGRIGRLCAARPELRPRKARFWSLEAFRLDGYRKVLFCDSDLLFRQPVDDLFRRREALLCCGDGPFHCGHRRDAATFLETAEPAGPGALERTFNAGFLLIDAALTGGRDYGGLLSQVAPGRWRGVAAAQTDQIVYNRHFAGRQTLVGATYNYLLAHARDIRAHEGLAAGQARVLHFNMRAKPWQMRELAQWAAQDQGALLLEQAKAFDLWNEAFRDQLAALHLRARVRGLRRAAPPVDNDACGV